MLGTKTTEGDGLKIQCRTFQVRRSGGEVPARLLVGPAAAHDGLGDADYAGDAMLLLRTLKGTLPAGTWDAFLGLIDADRAEQAAVEARMAEIRAEIDARRARETDREFEVDVAAARRWAAAALNNQAGSPQAG